MIKAIVIELEHYHDDGQEDGYIINTVYGTDPVRCTIVYPDGDSRIEEVVVERAQVISKMAPIPLASITYEKAMGMVLGPALEGLTPTTIAGVLKNLARLHLKDMDENPDEWGLMAKPELYSYVCYGKYSGEVYDAG